jgi:hypothetical protein
MIGVPEPSVSLLNRVRGARPPTAPMGPVDAGRQIDSGGMSAAGFGASPVAQGGYGRSSQHPTPTRLTDGYDAATRMAVSPSRLVNRISPQRGVRKEVE